MKNKLFGLHWKIWMLLASMIAIAGTIGFAVGDKSLAIFGTLGYKLWGYPLMFFWMYELYKTVTETKAVKKELDGGDRERKAPIVADIVAEKGELTWKQWRNGIIDIGAKIKYKLRPNLPDLLHGMKPKDELTYSHYNARLVFAYKEKELEITLTPRAVPDNSKQKKTKTAILYSANSKAQFKDVVSSFASLIEMGDAIEKEWHEHQKPRMITFDGSPRSTANAYEEFFAPGNHREAGAISTSTYAGSGAFMLTVCYTGAPE